MFASTEIAARIEAAECCLLREASETIAAAETECDSFIHEIAGGLATFTVDGMPFNKLAGLGFAGVPTEGEIAEVEEAFRRRGASLQVEVSSLGDPGVGVLLTRRGYTFVGVENVLARSLPVAQEAGAPGAGIELSILAPDDLEAFADVLIEGFATPDTMGVASHESFEREVMERSIRLFSRTRGMRQYLVTRDGEPAGAGSMRLTGGIAQMCGAATLPAHRRRGIQSLLLSRRLADAAAAGCDVAVITTQPGSKSHENVHRRGFELIYVRSILVKELSPAAPS